MSGNPGDPNDGEGQPPDRARRRAGDLQRITMEVPVVALGLAQARRPFLIVLAGPRIGELIAIRDGMEIGRDPGAGLHLLDEGVSRRHCRLTMEDAAGGQAVRLTDLDSTNGTWIGNERIGSQLIGDGDRFRVGQTTVIKFAWQDAAEEKLQRQMLDAALRDPLTGAFNRRYLLDRLDQEVALAARQETPLSLLLLDVDRFELVNRLLGRDKGDELLARLAATLARAIRGDDVLARLADDGFAVIAPGTHREGGRRFAERLRSVVADALFEAEATPVELRISIGAAASLPHASLAASGLLGAAQEALDRAKAEGRNRVCIQPGEAAPPPTDQLEF